MAFSSKQKRISILTVWSLAVCVMFFMFHRNQQQTSSKFLGDNVDEAIRLAEATSMFNHAFPRFGSLLTFLDVAGSGANKDLTNGLGEEFNPEKEYAAILSETPGKFVIPNINVLRAN